MTQRLLLCTDLDRTLIPNGEQPESTGAREYFRQLVSQPQVTLAYVTGRHQQLVKHAILEYQLPEPDFVIADVGSSIYEFQSENWKRWSEWEDRISADWAGYTRFQLSKLLSDFSVLDLQEPEKQNTHKLSYYVPENLDQDSLFTKLRERLGEHHIHARLIWSLDENIGTGLLDVLPASAGKRHAIEFLMKQRGFLLQHTVFSGDSGNDLTVLASPIPAILVANASSEIKSMAQEQSENAGFSNALYLAKGGYLNMNGNYSAGILEGVMYYMPTAQEWLAR